MAGVGVKIACMVVLCMLVSVTFTEAAVSCGGVISSLRPCMGYLKSGGKVPPPCCSGVRGLNSAAKTPADRQQVCNCLKNGYKAIPGINPNLAAGLPGACGVNIPYKISPSTDCSKVH
ncbi:hypothetical protein E9840_12595 [Tissierella creatinini]|nr:hypothetical protein E9840_12595 [Tissierella creatinini]